MSTAAVDMVSSPLDKLLAEQARRPHQQKGEGDYIGEPALDAAAKKWPDIDFGELLRRPDQQPPDNGAEDRIEPSQHQDRESLQHHQRQRELHPEARAPQETGH